MLLTRSSKPERSVYFGGGSVLESLRSFEESPSMVDLYDAVKSEHGMSASMFIMCLDWLYLCDAVKVEDSGLVCRCS